MVEMLKAHPEIYTYLTLPIMNTPVDLINFYDKYFKASREMCLYAIYDKTTTSKSEQTDNNYAGVISLNDTDPISAVTEIGVITFPAFQRTYVTSNAIGLTLLWLLDPPSAGGLGLRRVIWKAAADNAVSRRVALRTGFELEGIMRWARVSRSGAGLSVEALEKRNGTEGESMGQHTAVHSIVWDEWEGKRPNVVKLMERR
jgi:RimJ/RimL family protein N-acetyltransferase